MCSQVSRRDGSGGGFFFVFLEKEEVGGVGEDVYLKEDHGPLEVLRSGVVPCSSSSRSVVEVEPEDAVVDVVAFFAVATALTLSFSDRRPHARRRGRRNTDGCSFRPDSPFLSIGIVGVLCLTVCLTWLLSLRPRWY